MTELYTREEYIALVRQIALLIKERSHDIEPDALQKECNAYGHFLFGKAQSWLYLLNNQSPADTQKELETVYQGLENAIAALEVLSVDAQLHLQISHASNGLHPDLNGYDYLKGLLYQGDNLLKGAFLHSQKGRPRQFKKEDFIEAVIQVYETATGTPLSSLDTFPVQQQREVKTRLYKLLDLAAFDDALFQSKEAVRKFTDRYIEAGRESYDDVAEDLQNTLKEGLPA